MPNILPFGEKLKKKAQKYGIQNKLAKQCQLLSENPRHPSLHLELLEPHEVGLYSFRIDRKFRAIFYIQEATNVFEIISITVHYH